MSSNNPGSSARGTAPITIEAKSLEQALVKAAGTLGLAQDEMDYQVLKEETSKGLFSFFKNPSVEIKAWPKRRGGGNAPQAETNHGNRPAQSRGRSRPPRERDHEEDDQSSAIKAEPLAPEKVEALKLELSDFCAGIVSYIAGEPVSVSASVDDGRLILNIDSEYVAQQIAKNSKLAEAMEHILRKKPRHLRQELPFRIFVDVNGLRRKREEDLIQMAHDLSAQVHENKRPIVLNYKSSYDRKIIHMALDKDDRVYTKSIGSGPNRKLMILPNKDGAQQLAPLVIDGE